MAQCSNCDGKGEVRDNGRTLWVTCPECGGSGQKTKKPVCPYCKDTMVYTGTGGGGWSCPHTVNGGSCPGRYGINI